MRYDDDTGEFRVTLTVNGGKPDEVIIKRAYYGLKPNKEGLEIIERTVKKEFEAKGINGVTVGIS